MRYFVKQNTKVFAIPVGAHWSNETKKWRHIHLKADTEFDEKEVVHLPGGEGKINRSKASNYSPVHRTTYLFERSGWYVVVYKEMVKEHSDD